MRIGIVGCGLIGQKRARTLAPGTLAICCDVNRERAEALARQWPGARPSTNWEETVSSPDLDIVLVATTHDLLPVIAERAAAHGKHVLIEKPGARRARELEAVKEAALRSNVRVRVGFNHRFHFALQKAREIFDSGSLGELYYVRARYGHGGRPGYDREWRANPEISGGGEAIDQGLHLIDLARWFMGELRFRSGAAKTYFWGMPVEDNAFLLLETPDGQIASLQAGWTEWKNLFSFEICCRMGKLEVSGLGGSYGVERVTHYQMQPEMGPPPTVTYEYPMADDSWNREWRMFLEDIKLGREPQPGIADAQAALKIVEDLYATQ